MKTTARRRRRTNPAARKAPAAFPLPLPGPHRGKIDPKLIRDAVIKVRNDRLARERTGAHRATGG